MTPEQLVAAMPALSLERAAAWAGFLNEACERFDITTERRQAAFIAQVAHESRELSRLQESLDYRSAERLREVFGKRFAAARRDPREFVRKPEAIANFVYANRLGNGDEASGDGWRYRGRGPIQLTGRYNYRMAGVACGWPFEHTPDLVLDPRFGSLAAAWFWYTRGCNELADVFDFIGITQRINGPAMAGLEDRQRYWMAAREALGVIA